MGSDMQRKLLGIVLLAFACSSANAALLSRAGGQAYYDTDTDLTWVADATLAYTNDFGVTGIYGDGTANWNTANEWIGAMNTANYLGYNGWRLPTVTDTSSLGCDFGYAGTDCGYNVDLATGELARMFYSTLGNTGYYDTGSTPTGCNGTTPYCLTNTGPFSNLQSSAYWSSTEYAPSTSNAWFFDFQNGVQNRTNKLNGFNAWAVHSGDFAVIPLPPAVWLFGSALGVMGWLRRKAA